MLKTAEGTRPFCARCYQKQRGNAALLGLGWCVMAVLALVMLWLLAPLLIGIVVGLGVTVLLCQSIRISRVLQRRRALRVPPLGSAEAIEASGEAARTPRWVPFAAMLFTLIGGVTGWLTLFWLPEGLHPAQVLPLGTALLCALVVFVLVWLVGQLSTGWSHLRQGQAWNAASMPSDWWVWALLWALPTGVVTGLAAPNQASQKAWGEQWRGYYSVPIRIALAPAGNNASRQQRDAALLQLVGPLLEQGSRRVEARLRTRNGTTVMTAAIPARYRWADDALEIRLAGELEPQALALHMQAMQGAARGDAGAWMLLGMAQCQPAPSAMAALSMAHRRAQWQRTQACARERGAEIQRLAAVLQGQISAVQVLPGVRFRPWPLRHGWQAVDLPSGEALETAPLLAR